MTEIERIKEIIKFATPDALPEAIEQYVIKARIEGITKGFGLSGDEYSIELAQLKKGLE